ELRRFSAIVSFFSQIPPNNQRITPQEPPQRIRGLSFQHPFTGGKGINAMKRFGIKVLLVVGALVLLKQICPANPISRGVDKVFSYCKTAWVHLTHKAQEQVPLEFELDRIRNEIARLDDDMRGYLSPIAEEMATVKELKRRVKDTRAT